MPNPTERFEPLLTLQSAASLLGLHSDTLKKLARSGRVPAMKIGKSWRFRASELDSWVRTKLVSAQPNRAAKLKEAAWS